MVRLSLNPLSIDIFELAAIVDLEKSKSLLNAQFKKHKMELGIDKSKKSDKIELGISGSKTYALDIYLFKSVLEEEGTFDILRWWTLNSERFLILSYLAHEIGRAHV